MAPRGRRSPTSEPGLPRCAHAILSLAQRTVYLVGGETLSGQPTAEIWRYGLESREWAQERLSAPGVAHVLAAGYDQVRHRILVLDERRLPWVAPKDAGARL